MWALICIFIVMIVGHFLRVSDSIVTLGCGSEGYAVNAFSLKLPIGNFHMVC